MGWNRVQPGPEQLRTFRVRPSSVLQPARLALQLPSATADESEQHVGVPRRKIFCDTDAPEADLGRLVACGRQWCVTGLKRSDQVLMALGAPI
eukprot:3794042-Rhodomonas_salina.2